MDEIAERAKLALLDLTDDVIELILDKKRKTYAKKQEEVTVVEIVDTKIQQVEEETYYPPQGSSPERRREPEPLPLPPPPPVIPEPPMDRTVEPIIRKRGLPWQKK